jgi:hypothetical protein
LPTSNQEHERCRHQGSQHAANEPQQVVDRLELTAFARYDMLDTATAVLTFVSIVVKVDDKRAMDRDL